MEFNPQQDLLTEEKLIVHYAGFWPRFWALLLDGLILSILTPINLYNKSEWKSLTVLVCIFLIQIAYKIFFEFMYGATPGKMALKIRVVNYQYEKPTFSEAFLRNILQTLASLVYMALGIYSLNEPMLDSSTYQNADGSLNAYTTNGNPLMFILLVELILLAMYIIDLIFLLTNDEHRSLHDRIGKTYVIRN